ncbi:MAG TPA: permease-like cell division protein FtsX, partial [Propionibacteriaceae bacterium]|nr:permease-like cell division protein FtsX [Propionibacteriaceae bacterium]
MRHTFRETWSGLRRNLSMTIAVIVTMWVSLTLFGAGLMTMQQVDLIKDKWYDKIEISVFLCVEDLGGGNCDAGQDATQAQKDLVRTTLEANPEVEKVYYETKEQAYEEFRKVYKDSALLETVTQDQMQDSYRVKLKDPKNYQGVVEEATPSQVLHERRARAVGEVRLCQDATRQVVVLVPATVEQLHTPHTTLQQPPREHTVGRERPRLLGVFAV